MTIDERPTLTISEPGELIEAIPYLLGFHPADSLVLVGFRDGPPGSEGRVGRRAVQVCLRIDLPDEHVRAADIRPLADALVRSGVESVAAVLVMTGPDSDPRRRPVVNPLVEALLDVLAGVDVALLDVLVTGPERWWSMLCCEPHCCPADGTPRRLDASRSAAQAVYSGLVALPDRAAVAAVLTGRSAADRQQLEPVLAEAEHRVSRALLTGRGNQLRRNDRTALLAAAHRAEAGGRPLTPARLARLAVALTDIDTRDHLWLAIDDGSLTAGALLLDLCTRLPAPYDAAPLFLYGWAQWRVGNGTLAGIAAERARASDPGYSAAGLLLTALGHGLDPRTTPPLREPLDTAGATAGPWSE